MLSLTMFYDISNSPHTPICPTVSSNDNEEDRGKENEEDRREGRGALGSPLMSLEQGTWGPFLSREQTSMTDTSALSSLSTNLHK